MRGSMLAAIAAIATLAWGGATQAQAPATGMVQLAQGGPGGGRMMDAPIYGRQLMTEQERNAYRERMRNAKSAAERERIRRENHDRMQARARERGVTLPDEPPADRGPGMGRGMGGQGMGGGMGGGSGMGGGRR